MIIQKEDVLLDSVMPLEDVVLENIENTESKTLDENSINEENHSFNDLDINTACEENEESSENISLVSEEPLNNSENQEVLEKKETVETNCLALTVRKNYNISIFKNTVFTTFRVTCKVTIFTLVLNFLSLFF